MDFPRIDLAGPDEPQERAWFVDFTDTDDEGLLFRGITGVDFGRTVTTERWAPHEAEHAGEATFVPDPTGRADPRWLLSFVYDRRTDVSVLAVFDPEDLASGPAARIMLPRRVPFGFHGTWSPDPG